tara:strand:- start:564 stop:833 length:270 start_codon:yes stop_codon:yes gene_type:complete
MNLQTLKSGIVKGQTDLTKEVVVVIDNKEYSIGNIVQTIDKVIVTVSPKIPTHVEKETETPIEAVIEKATKEVSKKTSKTKKDESGTKG